ncbi:hypothetical protein ACEWY4_016883 [Coilia grayii]|uniref:ribonuclease H n=1 Tax=Coilia grayii TaxID=363190 RepID=A0ABD1JLN2_9TELE
MPEVFAVDDLSYGNISVIKHHIRLQDDIPFRERPRPIHPSDREAVKQHLRELLDAGIIRESESPFASPIVVVKKKNGNIHLCVVYRKLNMRTIKDPYALPNIEDTFSALSGAKWFSVMDLKSGYYQVEVAEEDKHKTVFLCPLGFWEFNRMLQGVTNAPSTFQRLMEKCVGDLHLNEVLVFLDDLIVFSKTLEEHETRLMKVLNRLKDYGLKLSPDKCHFFQTSVKDLGHIVDAEGAHTDPSKVSALKEWFRPTNRKELKCFLGFAGYYHRFVEGYSKIAKPLNSLTSSARNSMITFMAQTDRCVLPEPSIHAESLALDASAIPDDFESSGQGTIPGMTQREDPSIRRVISFLQGNQKLTFKETSSESLEVKLLLREWKRLQLQDRVLFWGCLDRGTEIHQLVLPILLAKDVPVFGQFQSHFTKFAIAVPTRDQKANTVAKTLWDNFIVHYVLPSRLLIKEETSIIKELCSLIGMEKVRTTPYHPRGNPVERDLLPCGFLPVDETELEPVVNPPTRTLRSRNKIAQQNGNSDSDDDIASSSDEEEDCYPIEIPQISAMFFLKTNGVVETTKTIQDQHPSHPSTSAGLKSNPTEIFHFKSPLTDIVSFIDSVTYLPGAETVENKRTPVSDARLAREPVDKRLPCTNALPQTGPLQRHSPGEEETETVTSTVTSSSENEERSSSSLEWSKDGSLSVRDSSHPNTSTNPNTSGSSLISGSTSMPHASPLPPTPCSPITEDAPAVPSNAPPTRPAPSSPVATATTDTATPLSTAYHSASLVMPRPNSVAASLCCNLR